MEEFTFDDIRDEFTEDLRLKSISPNQSQADTRINPPGCILNKNFANDLPRIRNFVVYPDDTWVLSFPKCETRKIAQHIYCLSTNWCKSAGAYCLALQLFRGTTWTQEMVWLLKNDLDYCKAKSESIRVRFPFFERRSIHNQITDEAFYLDTIELAAKTPRPRCIKSHLPPQLLPKQIWTVKPQIVYVGRDPKDVVVSYYHHYRLICGFTGSLQDFFRAFIADRVVYAPYWDHIKSWWSLRNEDNVLYNTYEEMKSDLGSVVRRTAQFLNVKINEEQVAQLCQHLSFANMQKNDSVNYTDVGKVVKETLKDPELKFIRSGESGGWRKHFTSEMTAQMDEWTRRNLSGSNLKNYPTTAHE